MVSIKSLFWVYEMNSSNFYQALFEAYPRSSCSGDWFTWSLKLGTEFDLISFKNYSKKVLSHELFNFEKKVCSFNSSSGLGKTKSPNFSFSSYFSPLNSPKSNFSVESFKIPNPFSTWFSNTQAKWILFGVVMIPSPLKAPLLISPWYFSPDL